jgi:predicted metal-binding membrane protein
VSLGEAAFSAGRPQRQPATVLLWAAAALAWAGTLAWAAAGDMGVMPGTMGLGFGGFVALWALMMAGMMLPSVSPFVCTYARTVTTDRFPRLFGLAVGYLAAWAVAGVGGYLLARAFGSAASREEWVARTLAAGSFSAAGLYQLTPLKRRCLSHCRSPIAHLFHYASFRGRTRDLRAGFLHGLFCLGCCWALMVLLVAFGVMNVWAMVGVAAVIAVEKLWRHGEHFARAVGVAALVYAVLVAFSPGLAPGLDPSRAQHAERMPMDTDVRTGTDGDMDGDMDGEMDMDMGG